MNGQVILAFSMSLDGFIAGPKVSVDVPMGEGGMKLHDWLFHDAPEGSDGIDARMAKEAFAAAGATVMGKRTFEVGLPQWEDTPYPVPSFVLTREARPSLPQKSASFMFVTDGIASAISQAKAAAGAKDVVVMGANAAQQTLIAGLADELVIQLVPVLLGDGTQLFGPLANPPVELEQMSVVQSPFVTHLRYRVRKR